MGLGRITSLVLLLCGTVQAQGILPGVMNPVASSSVPGPFNFTLVDYSSCTSGSAPTTTQLGNSMFPSLPSGASWAVTNTNTDVTCSTAETYLWPTFTLTGGAWPNTSAYSIALATGTAGDNINFTFPSGTVQTTVSACVPIYATFPQNGGLWSRIDLWTLDTNGSPSTLLNGQLQGTASNVSMLSECAPGGGSGATACTGGEGTNGVWPTDTWQIMCHEVTVGSGGSEWQAMWNTPQNGGTLISNSLIGATGSFTTGKNQNHTFGLGTNGGLTANTIYSGAQVYCGLITSQSTCGFPLVPGLQLFSPTISPASENTNSNVTVTMTNISSQTDSYYYTTCSTAGCTPSTPTTSSTLYTGSFTATPPEAVSAIAARTSYVNSAVTTNQYVATNATYVSSAQHEIASGTSNQITGLSIPSGDIVVVQNNTSSGGGTLSVADSNSDTFGCGTTVVESTNGNRLRLCVTKAGATLTTVTCSTSTTNAQACIVKWYSAGSLAGTLDQSTGQDQPDTQTWTSGNMSTLGGSSDLIVSGWNTNNTSITNTPSDGSTNNVPCSSEVGCGMTDRTGWGTSAQSCSGTWNTATYGTAACIAVK